MAMTEDFTERSGPAEALREMRQRYALATDAGGVGVWDRDLATDALYLAPALYALLGFDAAELAAATLWPGRDARAAGDTPCASPAGEQP
jgi:PAS domain-containing protein